MAIHWQDVALGAAGIIGCGTAVLHGVLVERLMVRPLRAGLAQERRIPGAIRRLIPALLQFSTFNWFFGGLVLIAAALWFGAEARLAVAVLVGSSYLFGATGNLWATRGRHPGWMLMALALVLMGFALYPAG
jgi:hypothetical protein